MLLCKVLSIRNCFHVDFANVRVRAWLNGLHRSIMLLHKFHPVSMFHVFSAVMPFVWLVSYPYGMRRDYAAKQRLLLPRLPYFEALGVDLSNYGSRSRFRLVGLAKVSAGHEHFSILTPWTLEERIAHHYFREAADAYTVNIDSFWPTLEETILYSCRQVNEPTDTVDLNTSRRRSVSYPSDDLSRIRLKADIASDDALESENQVVQGSLETDITEITLAENPHYDVENIKFIRMLVVVDVVANLISRSAWSTLMLLKSWFRLDPTWAWPSNGAGCCEELPASFSNRLPLSKTLESSSDFVRRLLPIALEHVQDQLERDRLVAASKRICFDLHSWLRTTSPEWDYGYAPSDGLLAPTVIRGRGGLRYSARHVYSMATLAMRVGLVTDAIEDVVKLAVDFIALDFAQVLNRQAYRRSKDTLHYAILLTDVGATCYTQSQIPAARPQAIQ